MECFLYQIIHFSVNLIEIKFWNPAFYFTIKLFLLILLHILGLTELVAKDVNKVKDIVENASNKVKKAFDETKGKHISLAGLRRFI